MRKAKAGSISEVLKVRHYVMNIIYHSQRNSVAIPTVQALAGQFGVAKSTVQLALKELSEQGYLIGKPGIGTFTNPNASFILDGDRPVPLVGVKIGGGDLFYYGYHLMSMMSAFGLALTERNCSVRFLDHVAAKPGNVAGELSHSFVDGLVCGKVDNAEYLAEAAARVPLANFNDFPVPGAYNLLIDYREARRHFGDYLGGRTIHICEHAHPYGDRFQSEIRLALEEAGHPPDLRLDFDPGAPDRRKALTRLLRETRPEALLIFYQQAEMVTEIFADLGLDPLKDCLLVSNREPPAVTGFRGAYFRSPMREAARLAAEWMGGAAAGGVRPPPDVRLDVEFIVSGPRTHATSTTRK